MKNSKLLSIVLVSCISFVFTGRLLGQFRQPVSYTSSETSLNTLSVGDTLTFSELDFGQPSWADVDTHLYVNHSLYAKLNYAGSLIISDSARVAIAFKTIYTKEDSTTEVHYDTLRLHYNPFDLTAPQRINVARHRQGFYKAQAIIEAITVNSTEITLIKSLVQIFQQFDVVTLYETDCSEIPLPWHIPVTTLNDVQYSGVNVYWDAMQGANEYDFEWTFLDTLSQEFDFIRDSAATTIDFNRYFKFNATRISTTQQSYFFFPVYAKGIVLYRVRAVYLDGNGYRYYSPWSTENPDNNSGSHSALGNFRNDFRVKGHQPDMNWSYTSSYAEEGKAARSIDYFDGTLRSRQSQSYLNEEGTSVIGEGHYDKMARKVMDVMPTPSFRSRLQFDPLYNQSADGLIDPATFLPNNCTEMPDTLDPEFGSSRYYSPNNDKINEGLNAYIPDANGYPYALSTFTPDNTGRVIESSAPGEAFILNGDHTTKYLYGNPSQNELLRFFGNEAGSYKFYKKNAVIDPNGQISISILDNRDKVVATGLAGLAPDNVTELPNITSTIIDTIPLLDTNQIRADGKVISTSNLIVTTAGKHVFNYSVYPKDFSIDCMAEDLCFDCVYDLVIRISDQCGNDFNTENIGEPYVDSLSNFTLGEIVAFDTICGNNSANITYKDSIDLPVGQYVVEKILSINQQALNFYLENVLAKPACVPPLESLVANAEGALNFSACDLTCEACLESIGDSTIFIDDYVQDLTDADSPLDGAGKLLEARLAYRALKEDCDALCGLSNDGDCSILYDILVADITPPFGQYAMAEESGGIYTGDYTDGTFTVYNVLVNSFQWNYTVLDYFDENGAPDFVLNSDGVLRSPDQLTVDEFVRNWKPSWAKSLVALHPEYIYYEWCNSNITDDMRNYDRAMMKTETYAEAESLHYFNYVYDPFSALTRHCVGDEDQASGHTTLGACLNEYLTHFNLITANSQIVPCSTCATTWSAMELASSAFCASTSTTCDISGGAFLSYFSDPAVCSDDKDRAWKIYRTLYQVAKKQVIYNEQTCKASEPLVSKNNKLIGARFADVTDEINPAFIVGDYDDADDDVGDGVNEHTSWFAGCVSCITPNNDQTLINYNFAFSRVRRVPPPIYISNLLTTNDMPLNTADAQVLMTNQASVNCESYKQQWRMNLQECFTEQSVTAPVIEDILEAFKQICVAGTDGEHSMGASSSPTTVSYEGHAFHDFEDVLRFYLGATNYQNIACQAINLPFPATHQTGTYYGAAVSHTPDDCTCRQIHRLDSIYQTLPSPEFDLSGYIQQEYGQTIAQSDIDRLMDACAGLPSGCASIEEPISLIPIFACGQCMDCGRISQLYLDFRSEYPAITSIIGNEQTFTNYLNTRTGFSNSYFEYQDFLLKCSGNDSSYVTALLTDGPDVDGGDGWPSDTTVSADCAYLRDQILSHNTFVLAPDQPGYQASVVSYLNTLYGLTMNFQDYLEFVQGCDLTDTLGWDTLGSNQLIKFDCDDIADMIINYNLCHDSIPPTEYCRMLSSYLNSIFDTVLNFRAYHALLDSCFDDPYMSEIFLNADSCLKDPRYLDCTVLFNLFSEIIVHAEGITDPGELFFFIEYQLDNYYDSTGNFTLCEYLQIMVSCPEVDSAMLATMMGGNWPECNAIDCMEIYYLVDSYNDVWPGGWPTSDDWYVDSVTAFLNDTLGFNKTYCDYWLAIMHCYGKPFATDLLGHFTRCYELPSCESMDSTIAEFYAYYSGIVPQDPTFVTYFTDYVNTEYGAHLNFCDYFNFVASCHSIAYAVDHLGNWELCGELSCEKLISYVNSFVAVTPNTDPDFMAEITDYLNIKLRDSLTFCDYHSMLTYCMGKKADALLGEDHGCDTTMCYSCDTIKALAYEFHALHAISEPNYPLLLSSFMNNHTGWDLTFEQYKNLYETCFTKAPKSIFGYYYYTLVPVGPLYGDNVLSTGDGNNYHWEDNPNHVDYSDYQIYIEMSANTTDLLCDDGIFPQLGPPESDCMSQLYDIAYASAIAEHDALIDSLRAYFINAYTQHCLYPFGEDFKAYAPYKEYHFTLYYYDAAGNLVKTVPPKGVKPLTGSNYWTAYYHNKFPATFPTKKINDTHTLTTRYWYNSLNQVVKQYTPDGDTTRFWYDNLGRLILSQSARQNAKSTYSAPLDEYLHYYSYTKYDALNRIIEVGEVQTNQTKDLIESENPTYVDYFWSSSSTFYQSEIVRTWYDSNPFNTIDNDVFDNFGINGPENLRSRVTATATYRTNLEDVNAYQFATHYSYDITGNVKTLIHDNQQLADMGHNIKRIDYDYDLASGKVNYLWYQKDSVDQFIHKYHYDVDNRLINVETSSDGTTYHQDAAYTYYPHGPLENMTLGDGVQGSDYYYTLQGWIKGVNSPMLRTSTDPGKGGSDLSVAKDVYGYNLGYFEGDFQPIGSSISGFISPEVASGTSNPFKDPTLATPPSFTGQSMYNGNIRHMVQGLNQLSIAGDTTVGYTYGYDQLNRLMGMDAWTGIDVGTKTWNATAPLQDYKERVSYDENGNILSYLRNGTTQNANALEMDNFNYKYIAGTNQLKRVDDNGAYDANYTNDIDGQSDSLNYEYDASGNLTKDLDEDLEIYWTAYGKVDSIFNTDDLSSIKFLYDAGANRIGKRVRNSTGIACTWYSKDAQGNQLATYKEDDETTLKLSEQTVYGSSRLGLANSDAIVFPRGSNQIPQDLIIGSRQFELSNHLGNVLATISDLKGGVDAGIADGITDYFDAEVISEQSYCPFGMIQPEMQTSNSDYDFGFNGMEQDVEVKGAANSLNFGARIYDPRLARWLSVDPKAEKYSDESCYSFAGNSPILFLDSDGKIKTTYVRVVAKDGSETFFKIINKEYVKEVVDDYTYIGYFDGGLHPVKHDYDVVEFVTVNYQTNTVTKSDEIVSTPTKGFWEIFTSPHKDSEQNGGEAIVSKEFWGSMSKFNPKSKTPAKTMNIDVLITSLRGGAELSGVGKIIGDVLKEGQILGDKVGEAFLEITETHEKNEPDTGDTTQCDVEGGCHLLHTGDQNNVAVPAGRKYEEYPEKKSVE